MLTADVRKYNMMKSVSILEKIEKNKKEIGIHIGVWFIYYLFNLIWYAKEISTIEFFDFFLTLILWSATFYSYHLYIYPLFLFKKSWYLLILIIVVLFPLYALGAWSEENFIAFLRNQPLSVPFKNIIKFGSAWYVNFVIIALGYHFYGESIKQKQKTLIEEQKRLLIETELQATQLKLKDAELENLKAQLNPHFLFNVLWYIIVLIQETGDKKALKAVQILSEMMRYSMEKRGAGELVLLTEELQYAKNFIDLQILRTPAIKLDYQVEEKNIEGIKILPFVLISFIENAVKHGKLNEEENPLMIHLKVERNKNITFFVKNKISAMGQEWSSGIGLENVKSRLQRAYEHKHSLLIENDGTFYTTKLTIET